jgi:PAS domain S-box-containing protein
MSWLYAYTPYIWPMLAPAAFTAALAIYVWHRRSVPGARALVMAMLFLLPWAVSAALELAAVDAPTKIFWIKFQAVWQLPANTALLCFALEYANLGRWLTRRTLALLAIPPLLDLLLILTNGAHHWRWLGFSVEGYVRPAYGSGTWALLGYNYVLAALQGIILLWLFVRSPQHRWPVGLILISRLTLLIAFRLDVTGRNPFAPMDPTILSIPLTSALYAFALFRFHMFDLIPVARGTVIEQMREGMLVLDTRQRIVDLNPAAEKILGIPVARARGQPVADVLPAHPGLYARLDEQGMAQSEISLGTGHDARQYALQLSPLRGQRGLALGQLILLHDVTEEKRAQAQLMEQQRVVATLQEREHLARELHDSVGQTLGYVSYQVEAARKLLDDGQVAVANAQLARLAGIAQDAHADVREYILNLRAGPSPQQPFFPALRHYLDGFTQNYDIRTELDLGTGLDEGAFEPVAQAQLFRIIQEALSNARKHADARRVQVRFETWDSLARIIIQDDGRGFDPAQPAGNGGSRVGLQFMRERAEQLGGCLHVYSAPGQGTRVVVEVPMTDSGK